MANTRNMPGHGRARRWFELGWATIQRVADGGTDRAAAMAYYAIQSLFPALLVVVLVSLLLSSPDSVTGAVDWAKRQGLDPGLADSLQTTLNDAARKASSGAGVAAVIAAITSVSSASGWLAAAGRAIEPDSGRRRSRNPLTGRLRFSLWTLVLLVMLVLALVALTLGGRLADSLFEALGSSSGTPWLWVALRPPLVLLGIVASMLVLYRVAPDRIHQPPLRSLLPGSIVAGLGWVAASAAFAFYIRNLASIGATYGAFATPIVLLLWLWLSGVMVLLGAELNAELARRRGEYHGPMRLEGADDPAIAGHPAGALPHPRDDAALHGR